MWPGPFVHHLATHLPGNLGQFALGLQFGKLRLVIGIGDRARPQPVAQAEAHIVGPHDFADLAEMRVEEVLPVMRQAPLGQDRAAAGDDARHAVRGQRAHSAAARPAWTVK